MTAEKERFSLSRWSRRKLDARRAPEPAPLPPAAEEPVLPAAAPDVGVDSAPAPTAPVPAAEPEAPLPPIESLSIESDFRPFMAPKVDEATKRAALRKLFTDPHFNVMDGLDVYIDDYNKPDPMPADMLAKIVGVYDRLAAESAAKDAAEREAGQAPADDAAVVAQAQVPATETPASVAPHEPARAEDDAAPADGERDAAAAVVPSPLDAAHAMRTPVSSAVDAAALRVRGEE